MATETRMLDVSDSAQSLLPPDSVLFGESPVMHAVRQKIAKLALTDVPVLIEGESGTGKELIARYLHWMSPFSSGAFVKVNCPAIPGTLIESELFGFEKGSFTGAYGAKPGRVELADCGTLFLDEIGELDHAVQAKLLQFLQDGQFTRIGGRSEMKVSVRFVCATNRKLEDGVSTGSFRKDLYYRINVISLQLPPLRERLQDVPVLASYFNRSYSEKFSRPPREISPELMSVLQRHQWPGNIRELENVIKRFVVLGSEEELINAARQPGASTVSTLEATNGPVSLKTLSRNAVRELEREMIFKVLRANHWNRKRTARALNISYRALLYKIKEAGLAARRPYSEKPGLDGVPAVEG